MNVYVEVDSGVLQSVHLQSKSGKEPYVQIVEGPRNASTN